MSGSSSCDCSGSVGGWCQYLPCVLQSHPQMLWYKRISSFNPHCWDLGTLFCISRALAIFLPGRCGCLAHLVAFGMAVYGRVQILPVCSWIPSKLKETGMPTLVLPHIPPAAGHVPGLWHHSHPWSTLIICSWYQRAPSTHVGLILDF